jgi:hypothetical protein
MKHCEHFSDKIVRDSDGNYATVCERCVTEEDLAHEGYREATYKEVRELQKTNFTPPKLNPEWFHATHRMLTPSFKTVNTGAYPKQDY